MCGSFRMYVACWYVIIQCVSSWGIECKDGREMMLGLWWSIYSSWCWYDTGMQSQNVLFTHIRIESSGATIIQIKYCWTSLTSLHPAPWSYKLEFLAMSGRALVRIRWSEVGDGCWTWGRSGSFMGRACSDYSIRQARRFISTTKAAWSGNGSSYR